MTADSRREVEAQAARYRYLRDNTVRTTDRGKHGLFVGCGSIYSGFGQPYREDLDEVIDYAIAGGDPYNKMNELGRRKRHDR